MVLTASTMIELGTPAPAFDLPDVSTGRRVTQDSFRGKAALLVMFICRHCPFVQHVKHELGRLGHDLACSSVGVVAISSNDAEAYPEDRPESLRELARECSFDFPLCHDASQEVARAFGAVCTPDFFLFDDERRLAYRGRLDGVRPGQGEPDGAELRAAIEALLAGRPVSTDQQPSLGCNIKWRPVAA